MKFTSLEIDGLWLAESEVHQDNRGKFLEWFKPSELQKETGKSFSARQANSSCSTIGTLRGIHFSTSQDGQAKWVTCSDGLILDVVVDLRPKSKTFKKWIATELDAFSGNSLVISEGLGHAFLSLAENSVVNYLLSSEYSPENEQTIYPFDKDIAINWPKMEYKISDRDLNGKKLLEYLTDSIDQKL
jgi:dTDP-4-dehydrorhamnose 3,5-epimerase